MYSNQTNLSKADLLKDEEFLSDAQSYLLKRTDNYYESAEEIYDAWIEQSRISNVNEVSAIRDLNYVKSSEATDADKDQMGRLYLAYDNLKDAETSTWKKINDYGEGILTAPSTWLGLISGGASKIAGVGGTQAAVQLTKALATKGVQNRLRQGVAAGTRTFAVEGGIEAGAETARQFSRVESRAQEDVSLGTIGAMTAAAGLPAGVLSGVLQGGVRGAQQQGVKELLEEGRVARSSRGETANVEADKTLKENEEIHNTLIASSKTLSDLKELDQARVAAGKEKTKQLAINATGEGPSGIKAADDETDTIFSDFDLRLKTDRLRRITAATVELVKTSGFEIGKVKKDERIIDILANILSKPMKIGDEEVDPSVVFNDLLKKYDLDFTDIAAMFTAEFSEAGRVLQIASSAKRNLSEFFRAVKAASVKPAGTKKKAELTANVDSEVDKIVENHYTLWKTVKNYDAARRALMTVQPATTVRNTANAIFRTALHSFENIGQGIIQVGLSGAKLGDKELFDQGISNIKSSSSLFRYLAGNTVEAKAIQALYSEYSPEAAQTLFRSMADVAVGTSDEAKLANKGVLGSFKEGNISGGLLNVTRYANVLNTVSDNTFKRAVFASELAKEVGGAAKLREIISTGKFGEIDGKIFDEATKRALELTYQKSHTRGTLAQTLTAAFSQPGLSLLVPFPRFIANSLEFTYQHAPIIGLIETKAAPIFGAAGRTTSKKLAQQLSGMGMLFGAFQIRASMGPYTNWWEVDGSMLDTNHKYDAKALYGPFASYMLAADVFYRAVQRAEETEQNFKDGEVDYEFDDVIKEVLSTMSGTEIGKEAIRTALGTTFKTGVNLSLVDTSFKEYAQTGDTASLKKLAADGLGNIANSFTVGAGVAKDVLGTFYEEYQTIPNTQDVNWGARLMKRSMRSIPQAPIENERLIVPTRTGRVVRGAVPLLKQFTGLTPIADRNVLENELVKVGLKYYQLFDQPSADPRLRKAMNKMYGQISEQIVIPTIRSKDYRTNKDTNLPRSISEKRDLIKQAVEVQLSDRAGNKLTSEQYFLTWINTQLDNNQITESEYNNLAETTYKVQYTRISKGVRDRARSAFNSNKKYRQRYENRSFSSLTIKERLDFVKAFQKAKKIVSFPSR